MSDSRVKPIAGELMRFHVIGDSVKCSDCATLWFKVPWDEDEVLNACPHCHGKLERSEYLVDLSECFGNGRCNCVDFEMRHGPLLKHLEYYRLEEHARAELSKIGFRRCKHIYSARRLFLDEIIHKLSAGELKGVR